MLSGLYILARASARRYNHLDYRKVIGMKSLNRAAILKIIQAGCASNTCWGKQPNCLRYWLAGTLVGSSKIPCENRKLGLQLFSSNYW